MSIREQVNAFKREQIINAAVDLFFRNGYQQTTLDEVAEQLNVTKPFIYYHFRDKEEVLFEISGRSVAKAVATLAEAVNAAGSPTERLHWAIKNIMNAVIEQQRYTAVFFREQKNLSEQSREPLYAQHREYDKLLSTLLDEGIQKKEFIVSDARLCALALSGLTGWAYNWYRPGGRLSAERISELMAEMALRTVGVPEARIATMRAPG